MYPSLDSRHRSHIAPLVASLILACCFLPISSSAQTSAPQLIPFQGRLTNQAGVAYANGQYTITLNLYSLAIGGSTVWTERHEKVSVIGGMLNLFLGSIARFDKGTASLTDDVDFSTTKYLGITVDADNNPATADPEMVPRTMIVTAFYAKNTQKLAGADWSSILVSGNDPVTGSLNAAKLPAGSISNTLIANNAIGTSKIADGTITGADLAAGAADAAISTGAITSAKIADGTVANVDLADSSVTSLKIADATIVGADIAPESIPVGRLLQDYAFFWDERGNTQTGGTPVAGWNKRTLNQSNVRNGSTFASRTGDTITLEPGTYWVRASAPGHRVRRHAIALRDVTGNPATPVVVLKGTTEHSADVYSGLGEVDQNRSFIDGVISVAAAPKQFELWHWIQVPSADGLGGFPDAVGPGWSIWASLSIIRIK